MESKSHSSLLTVANRLGLAVAFLTGMNVRGVKESIVVLTPSTEVDGREKAVDNFKFSLKNPNTTAPGLVYWGQYVQHDNNRDGIGVGLNLTKNILKSFLDWHPQVFHDLHESVSYLYTSTGTGPRSSTNLKVSSMGSQLLDVAHH